jgi:chromosome segregation protein
LPVFDHNPMRLKHLELQGYKTFAARTEFVFDNGVTAIVGPNGSGKSNIADAIRWVLGEQSYRTLRGKRTEDMIFSGSAQRARLGMASASLTLDNADGWLPVEFSEVVVTRRAFRSGENEYLLNNRRVRLRDINELLAKSGLAQRTYTVIGQGLVDAVLSLRPDDRRALFEEASGISVYQSKRAGALSRLEETRANLLRVNDIINEIAPRMGRLQREAERAERHALLSQQLESLLRTWYGFRWRRENRALNTTRTSLERRTEAVERRRLELDELDERMQSLRTRQSGLREQLGDWHQESGKLHQQMEEVQRDLAVWQERSRALSRRRDELMGERAGLVGQAQASAERITAAEQELSEHQAVLRQAEEQVSQRQAALDAFEERRSQLSSQMSAAQAGAFELATQVTDRRTRLAQIEERRRALVEEQDGHRAALVELEAQSTSVSGQLQAIAAKRAQVQAAQEELRAQFGRLETSLADLERRQSELISALTSAQREAERLEARRDLLARLREEGEGLHAGVRAVVRAAAKHKLNGMVGTVAQLIHVPADYEVAVEVALGGHLQDIVVESWSAAERAIAYLQEGERGRATFLPLDTVRPGARLSVPAGEEVLGVAADLVQAEQRLSPVVGLLLGRTVVARDLKGAHRIFGQLQGGFQVVTLPGEILRSSGSVTGGQGQGQAQGRVLGREREWRELPDRLSAAHQRCHALETDLGQIRASESDLQAQMQDLREHRERGDRNLEEIRNQRRAVERDQDQISQRSSWLEGLISQLNADLESLDGSQASLRAELQRLEVEAASAQSQVEALESEMGRLRGEELYQQLSDARTAAALAQGTWQHRSAALDQLRDGHAALLEQIEAKEQRLATLEQEQETLAEQIRSRASRETVIQGWLAALATKIEPAEAEIVELEQAREKAEREESNLRSRLREAEHRHAEGMVAQSRQEERVERLRRQITDDFGLIEMEPIEGLPEQTLLPLGELVSSLPRVEFLPDGLEEEMHRIKAQMRRMGSVNPSAPEEYAEVLDRHTFLTSQAADLEDAAYSLRQVIAELDDVMRQEFQATFEEVASRFRENFAELFGGGSAHLVLTDPEDISVTGIEIIARPPGKRQQTLALLSGGERSLTAVALIFALLEVSPPPFCILDEVDAMLDEANVKRFRQALQALTNRTQFIIITHNRGTIKAADTIYGISMGDDSVSQVVSLRLEGERIAAPNGDALDVMKDG